MEFDGRTILLSLYVPQVRDSVHLPHTPQVAAQCTASCRLPLSPHARYVSMSGAIPYRFSTLFHRRLIRFALHRRARKTRPARDPSGVSRECLACARRGIARYCCAPPAPRAPPPIRPRSSSDRAPGASAKSAAADSVVPPSNRFHRPSPAPRSPRAPPARRAPARPSRSARMPRTSPST